MPTTTRSTRARALVALCAFSLLAVACGDDDTEAADATTTAPEGEAAGEYEEYCAAVAEMEDSEEFDAAQFERIRELAPEEISEEIDLVADAFIEAEGDFGAAFADPEVEEKLGPIEAFEEEHCASGDDEEDGDEAAIPAEAQAYCEKAAELDEQQAVPDAAQLEELRAAAPEEIAAEVGIVVDAFIAADGDIGKAFSDPTVEENLSEIEDYESNVCGIGGDDEEDDGDDEEEAATEPLEGAQVVEVSAIDFGFVGIPETVPAGATSFRFTNDGEAAHEMFMARLGDGVELDDLLAMDEEPSPEQAEEVGGTFAAPGASAFLNVEDLTSGTYGVVCFIPGPEGKAHHELGMKTTFTVA